MGKQSCDVVETIFVVDELQKAEDSTFTRVVIINRKLDGSIEVLGLQGSADFKSEALLLLVDGLSPMSEVARDFGQRLNEVSLAAV